MFPTKCTPFPLMNQEHFVYVITKEPGIIRSRMFPTMCTPRFPLMNQEHFVYHDDRFRTGRLVSPQEEEYADSCTNVSLKASWSYVSSSSFELHSCDRLVLPLAVLAELPVRILFAKKPSTPRVIVFSHKK